MHIGIVGPIATADIASLLNRDAAGLPRGYAGAPLLSVLIDELLRNGHRVSAFTLSSDMRLDRKSVVTADGKNFRLFFCPMRSRAWRPNGWRPGRIVDLYRFERSCLQDAITNSSPEVVHAHWAYEFALAGLSSGIPHVVTCHDSPYEIARFASSSRPTRSLYRWMRVLMAHKVLREAKLVTAVSPYMRDQVQTITSSPIVVVPNPVADRAISLGRARDVPAVPRLAMVCNGWDRRKNPETALMAFSRLREDGFQAELHLFGADFGSGQRAETWCRRKGITEGLFFHGSVPHRLLLDALAGLDLLVHPAREESFCMVIAEAMAMGVPVVAGEQSGAVPWVVGGCGTLCDINDSESIRCSIIRALEPQRYRFQSVEGINLAKSRFSAAAVVDQYCVLYEQARDGKR